MLWWTKGCTARGLGGREYIDPRGINCLTGSRRSLTTLPGSTIEALHLSQRAAKGSMTDNERRPSTSSWEMSTPQPLAAVLVPVVPTRGDLPRTPQKVSPFHSLPFDCCTHLLLPVWGCSSQQGISPAGRAGGTRDSIGRDRNMSAACRIFT